MNELKEKLIKQAKRQHKKIFPCAAKNSLGDCFTTEEDYLVFWFNTQDNSTHVLTVKYCGV